MGLQKTEAAQISRAERYTSHDRTLAKGGLKYF